MRKLFVSMLANMILVLLSITPVHAAMSINLVISDSSVVVGDSFVIDVWANDAFSDHSGDKIIAFGFDISNTDSSIVTLTSQAVGSLFNDDSASFDDTDVAGSAFEGLTDNNILLASLTFTALAPGDVTLGIVSEGINEGLIYSLFDENVNITNTININICQSADEVCDGVDNNCDGVIDEGCPCVIAIEKVTSVGQDAVVPINVIDIPVDIAQFSFDVHYDQNVMQYQIGYQQWGDCMAPHPAWGDRSVSLIAPGHLRIEGIDDGANPIPQVNSCNMVNLLFATTATVLSCDTFTLSNPAAEMANWSADLFCSAEICFNACVPGDVDQSQGINIDDVFCLFKHIMGRPSCLDGVDVAIITCANVDQKGGLNIDDVFCLFKKIMGRPSCMDGT